MQYRHAPDGHFAALDAVLVSAPGRPTLPVRLTVELLGRARARLGSPATVAVWDPCCGAGVTLTVLGLLCPGITALAGTDADPDPLGLARRNLALLGPGGPAARAAELEAMAARHGKESYAGAARAVRALDPLSRPEWTVEAADALDPAATRAALGGVAPDVVLADLPHGRQTTWARSDASDDGAGPTDPAAGDGGPTPGAAHPATDGPAGALPPEAAFLTAVGAVLAPEAVVVAVGRGRSVPLPEGVRALERVRAGHRAAALVRARDLHR
ncbi:rRNA methyltransferase [Pseudonocardia sp. C8]|uniref:rRNA methyltransferase n=1 Tax=Pseudonocardia sp. C8 TaxID=2762759 RepID=UPI00164349B7|nr:rRNA methyltransferase [Pseudonocardia sp. C8]